MAALTPGRGARRSPPQATRRPPPPRSAGSWAPRPRPAMGDPGPPPQPGPDEILLTASGEGDLCHALACRRAGTAAQVVVTFGDLGVTWQRDALWQDSWGRSYAMCQDCWQQTRRVAEQA